MKTLNECLLLIQNTSLVYKAGKVSKDERFVQCTLATSLGCKWSPHEPGIHKCCQDGFTGTSWIELAGVHAKILTMMFAFIPEAGSFLRQMQRRSVRIIALSSFNPY
jgi:hypothetical protein